MVTLEPAHDVGDEPSSIRRVGAVARNALVGGYDVLLACHELADLKEALPCVPDETMNAFVGFRFGGDGLPVGDERRHYARC